MPHASVITKLAFRQMVGVYDWPLAEQHWRSPYVYMANMQRLAVQDGTPFIEDQVRRHRGALGSACAAWTSTPPRTAGGRGGEANRQSRQRGIVCW